MSDDHGGACCEECALEHRGAKGAVRLPLAFQRGKATTAAFQQPTSSMVPPSVKPSPSGIVFGPVPSYPGELLSDCGAWSAMSYGEKLALASRSVPAWRAAAVVAELDLACGSPYSYPLFSYGYSYPWAFPVFASKFQNQPPVISSSPATNQRATEEPPTAKAAGQGSVGQGFIGASVGMGSVGQGYIGRQVFPYQPYTFGATPYPWNAAAPRLLPYWPWNGVAPAGQGYEGLPGAAPQTSAQEAELDAAILSGDQARIDAAIHSQPPVNSATPWLNLAANTIGTTGNVIIAAIHGQNESERIRLENETRLQIARLMASRPVSPTEQLAQQQQLAMMRTLMEQLTNPAYRQPPPDHTALYVGGAVAVVGLGALAMMNRGGGHRTNPVVGHGRNRHWVKPKRKHRRRAA